MNLDVTDIQKSFHRSYLGGVFPKFYELFLQSHPDVKRVFVHTDLKTQHELLRHGIQLSLHFDSGQPIAQQGLTRIRQTHSAAKMNIPKHLYAYWKASFLQAVELTDPQFTPQLRREWDRVLQKAIDFIST